MQFSKDREPYIIFLAEVHYQDYGYFFLFSLMFILALKNHELFLQHVTP